MSLRDLPPVDRLERMLPRDVPRLIRVEIARASVDAARQAIESDSQTDAVSLAQESAAGFSRSRQRALINATGVLLHTNLGRAPLHPEAAEAAREAATEYTNLEIELETGSRGGRNSHISRLLQALTGAEAAMVVNNNAGALFLTLIALAAAKSVPVSRGELIEIGGSYRLPELMAASGARLVEVGTTNRTRVGDHREAIDHTTGMLLKVHPSNYRIEGFAEEATLGELVGLANERALPMAFDAGSGLVDARARWLEGPPPPWLAGEPGIAQAVEMGVDLVMFSGDKLLGGPQAGVIVGTAELIGRLRTHPVARALRIDGPTAAALGVTLSLYADGRAREIPFWSMATADETSLAARTAALVAAGVPGEIVPGFATVGAGSVPGSEIPGPVLVLDAPADRAYLALLRSDDVPVVARREAGSLTVNLRSVDPRHDEQLALALVAACR
ncbi:MAG TPA: L-seryl-tRNA(Sec) selenium transferase [Acidimicrobiia bacterium]